MSKRNNLTGMRFGRRTVIAYAGSGKWYVACDCGRRTSVLKYGLVRTKSCGCARRKHGMSASPEYKSWASMKSRCCNPQHVHFANYGGRGIEIYQDWLSFEAFFADMGPRPKGCCLDRIDTDGHYAPGNVRWAPDTEQRFDYAPGRAHAAARTAKKRRQAVCKPLPPLDDVPF